MIGEFVSSCLILVLGYAYPSFQCFKTVEKNRVEIPELRFWCQYWIIVAVITILERIDDTLISWVPLYGEIKLALFIYLCYPKSQGTGFIYDRLLRPYLSKHETDIDRSLIEFRDRAWHLATYYWQNCKELGSTSILKFLEFVSSQARRSSKQSTPEVKTDNFCCSRLHPTKNILRLGTWVIICSVLIIFPQAVHGKVNVSNTILLSAIKKGAVCLDGTAPTYNYYEGSENGWFVFLEGGGWCYKLHDCYARSKTNLGSSLHILADTEFSGFLDSDCTSNPFFCNWHKVYIHYCDGSSFMSNTPDSNTNLTFRGARIFEAMMEELMQYKGMAQAQNAILSGTASGGLSTILHCDKFAALFPADTRVKCISDSGFFLHGKDLYRHKLREHFFSSVIETNGLANSLFPTCRGKRNVNLCLFPEYLVADIKTPLFIIESAFDQYQLTRLVLDSFAGCTSNLASCSSPQLGIMRDFRDTFIDTLIRLKNSSGRGMFIHSCYVNGHLQKAAELTCLALANKTLGKAIADWYYDVSDFKEIDIWNERPQNCSDFLSKCSLIQNAPTSVTSHDTPLTTFLLLLCLAMQIVYLYV